MMMQLNFMKLRLRMNETEKENEIIELEIKKLAETIYDLNAELVVINAMDNFNSHEKLRANYAQREWVVYKIEMAKRKINFIKGY